MEEAQVEKESTIDEGLFVDDPALKLTRLAMVMEHVYSKCLYDTDIFIKNEKHREQAQDIINAFHEQVLLDLGPNLSWYSGNKETAPALPLPVIVFSTSPLEKNKRNIELCEDTLVTWTQQIKAVLFSNQSEFILKNSLSTPSDELRFWRRKLNDCNSLLEQLQKQEVRNILNFLDVSNSPQCAPFSKICKELNQVKASVLEGVQFLEKLMPYVTIMEKEICLDNLSSHFKPILYCVFLIWKNSKFFNRTEYLVNLIQEICNVIISQCRKHLSNFDLSSLFVDEGKCTLWYSRIKAVLKCGGLFKSFYFEFKAKSHSEFSEKAWKAQNQVVFSFLDAFLERNHDLLDLVSTVLQFTKLKCTVVGGVKGKKYTKALRLALDEFRTALSQLCKMLGDMVAASTLVFDEQCHVFRTKLKNVDKQIVGMLVNSFDEKRDFFEKCLVLENFRCILPRDLVKNEVVEKQAELINMALDMIETHHRILDDFVKTREDYGAYNIVSAVEDLHTYFTKRERYIYRVRYFEAEVLQSHEGLQFFQEINKVSVKHQELTALLVKKFEELIPPEFFDDQETFILTKSYESNKTPASFYLVPVEVNTTREYDVLYDLSRKLRQFTDVIGDRTLQFFSAYANSSTYFCLCQGIVSIYNDLRESMNEIEISILRSHCEKVKEVAFKGQTKVRWVSQEIDGFMEEFSKAVIGLQQQKQKFLKLSSKLKMAVSTFSGAKVFFDMEGPMSLEDFEKKLDVSLEFFHRQCSAVNKQLVLTVDEALHDIGLNEVDPLWGDFVVTVNKYLLEKIAQLVTENLRTLLSHMQNGEVSMYPETCLLEAKAILKEKNIVLTPPFETDSGKSFKQFFRILVEKLVQSFASLKRVGTPNNTFVKELRQNPLIIQALDRIMTSFEATYLIVKTKIQEYEEFTFLWQRSVNQNVDRFLAFAYKEATPNVSAFERKLHALNILHEKVTEKTGAQSFIWLEISFQPLHNALLYLLSKNIQALVRILVEHISSFYKHILKFMHEKLRILLHSKSETTECFLEVTKVINLIKEKDAVLNEDISYIKTVEELVHRYNKDIGSVDFDVTEFPSVQPLLSIIKANLSLEKISAAFYKIWEAFLNIAFEKQEEVSPLQKKAETEMLKASCIVKQDLLELDRRFYSAIEFMRKLPDDQAVVQREIMGLRCGFDVLQAKFFALNEAELLLNQETTSLPKLLSLEAKLVCFERGEKLWTEYLQFIDVVKNITISELDCKDKILLLKNIQSSLQENYISQLPFAEKIGHESLTLSENISVLSSLTEAVLRKRHYNEVQAILGLYQTPLSMDTKVGVLLHTDIGMRKAELVEVVERAKCEYLVEVRVQHLEDGWDKTFVPYVSIQDHKCRSFVEIEGDIVLPRFNKETVDEIAVHFNELRKIAANEDSVFFTDRVQTLLGETAEAIKHVSEWENLLELWEQLVPHFIVLDENPDEVEDVNSFKEYTIDFLKFFKVQRDGEVLMRGMVACKSDLETFKVKLEYFRRVVNVEVSP
eukprot:snap_masked-scaffold_20-processed-gene-1.2-mRNA-1 protein AED:1.00 eAED:1.00 QI:0/-1/0/0/-1/1/1/0/1510